MTGFESLFQYTPKTSDAAVSGLIGGLASGLAMLAFLVVAGLLISLPPLETLARFAPGEGDNPMTGGLAHLAVSGMYGLVYGLLWHAVFTRLKSKAPRSLPLPGRSRIQFSAVAGRTGCTAAHQRVGLAGLSDGFSWPPTWCMAWRWVGWFN